MQPLYETLGVGYSARRRPDPRIAARIEAALGDARTVVNVGAGTGSYEPRERTRVAVEPSPRMIAGRAPGAGPAVRALGTRLPFRDGAFDASLAVLTLHHWGDPARGLDELARVARRAVVLTWDPAADGFWLLDYFPDILAIDREIFPPLALYGERLGAAEIDVLPVPADCVDGFLGAYWRRPEAYLRDDVRAAISTFARIDARAGLERLARDLESGAWHARHGELLAREELDVGYRLVRSRS